VADSIPIEYDAAGNPKAVSLATGDEHTVVIQSIHLQHLYHDDTPVQGASFVIQLANGTTVEGSLDETGEAEVPITAAPTQVQFGPDERDWAADDQEPNPDYRQFASSDEADAFVDARFQET
jgi:hypothetical protein